MRAQVEALVAHLKDLKHRGVKRVCVQDDTLDNLRRRVGAGGGEGGVAANAAGADAPAPMSSAGAPAHENPVSAVRAAAAPAPLPARPRAAFRAASAPVRAAPPEDDIPEPPVFTVPEGDKLTRWNWLKTRVLECPVCKAHVWAGRKVVFGVGSLDADIFFCGEAPGMEESQQGEPFVGPAGQLLTKMIGAMGLSRAQVYIGNIMNWRPRLATEIGNREPSPREMAFCLPYLKAQLEIVRPKVIVALGRTALNGLLTPPLPLKMGKVRGQWHDFNGIALMPTYHPSYLLRNQTLASRRQVWEDLLHVMERLNLPISEKQRGYFLKK